MSVKAEEKSPDANQLMSQLTLARKEINSLRHQLISLSHFHKRELESVHQKLIKWQCSSCRENDDSCEAGSTRSKYDFQTRYIGRITSHFPEKRGTPRQPGICNDMSAKLTLDNTGIFSNPMHALDGLQEFSHMWILYHFHKNDSSHVKAKVAPPRLNGIRTGVFASRSPHRPCPIGLSLVKIDRIMDNTIYFSGVDMVNETPVLDIKPYIPHYDSPGYLNANHATVLDDFLPQETSTEVGSGEASTSSNVEDGLTGDNLASRMMDGEENETRHQIVGATLTRPANSLAEEAFHTRSNSRIGEREAPDGEEEEPPRNPPVSSGLSTATTPEGHIRVPPWIDQPLVPRLSVLFKDRALVQLGQLGTEGEEKKTAITNVLREDPRSLYLRERWGGHCYVFRIAELYVSCKFNDSSKSVTVYQVFQNEAPSSTEGEE